MNAHSLRASICILGLAVFPVVRAGPPPIAQAEINDLLAFVELSACEFLSH
jgi:hypothetical protein